MFTNIYVGGLPYQATEAELQKLFAQYGEVASVKIITDRISGHPKGFAFVEMATQAAAEEAIKQLNGTELGGRRLMVNQARPKEKRGRRRRRPPR